MAGVSQVEAILGWRQPEGGKKGTKAEQDEAELKGVSQAEQGAVAALLFAAAGDPTSPTDPVPSEPEYCVKWAGRAHCYSEWLPESEVAKLAKRQLINFKRKHGTKPCSLSKPEWEVHYLHNSVVSPAEVAHQ